MTQIEVTFLGTSATVPTKHRNHPGLYIRYVGRHEYCFLFDCGEATQRQIFRYGLNFMRISAVFITHFHADHFAGLLTLLETMTLEGREKDLLVFGPEADEWVDSLFHLGYGRKKFRLVPKPVPFDEEAVVHETEEFEIHSFPVEHGIPAVGYKFVEKDRVKMDKEKLKERGLPVKGRIIGLLKEKGEVEYKGRTWKREDFIKAVKGKTLSYSGDTRFFPGLADRMKADVMIPECTYIDSPDDRDHMSLDDCISLYDVARPKIMLLTHFSRRYADAKWLEEEIKSRIGKRMIVPARDGMVLRYGKDMEIEYR